MKTYVLVDITVQEPEGFMEYVNQIPALISKYGGRYLVRGAEPETIHSGIDSPQYVVVLEFPSKDSAEAFFNERAEMGLADLFSRSTKSRILVAEGVGQNDPTST